MINELPGEAPPELVIGVDFGMTQTGIVYCLTPWNNPRTFQHWSINVNEIANKVPSRVAYDIQTGKLRSWGFGCDLRDPTLDVLEHFKLYLDPEYHDDYADISNQDAQRYFFDLMCHVYEHVSRHFQNIMPHWSQMKVEWIFSVPTTWRDAAFINSLERLIRDAGFGRDSPSHTCRVTLTEAEAAAISVASQYLERDDVILVCDAGGGTTDVNILKLISSRGQPLKLQPLSRMEGKPIGSALIDIRVQQLLEHSLQTIAHHLTRSAAETAEHIMVGRFERFKCNFGAPGSNIPFLLLDIPELSPGIDIPQANIHNSQIAITSETLKIIFDEQVDALVRFVHDEIHNLHVSRLDERINYIVLSGGLGSSPYVQDRLRWHFNDPAVTQMVPEVIGVKILVAEEPQLSVVHGLVLDRAQQISQSLSPISTRNARVSYGVVVARRYKPSEHKGQRKVKDKRDGKRWVTDQIEWLIREGDVLHPSGIVKRFRAKIDPHQLRQPWLAQFVVSMQPASQLPTSLNHPDVRELCIIAADISNTTRVVKNGHWWNLSRRYELTALDVKVIPGSADLKFEVWNDNRRLSGDHDSVQVKWETRLGNHNSNHNASPDLSGQYSPGRQLNSPRNVHPRPHSSLMPAGYAPVPQHLQSPEGGQIQPTQNFRTLLPTRPMNKSFSVFA